MPYQYASNVPERGENTFRDGFGGDGRLLPEPRRSVRRGIRGWWLNLTAPPPLTGIPSMAERERQRKAELTSYSILAVFLFLVTLVSNSVADPSTGEAVGTMAGGLILVAILNRGGATRAAGFLIPFLLMVLIMGAVIEAKGGLRVIWFSAWDLLALPVFISAFLLGWRTPWFFAAAAIAFIVGDLALQPHDLITTAGVANFDEIHYELGIWGFWGLVNRPIGLIAFGAFFGSIGAYSVDWAMRLLDRAEEIAKIERAVAEQRRQLEVGVRQILDMHVRIANGDFSRPAALSQDNVLWQIMVSLNNLAQRYQSAGQAQFTLERTEAAIDRLVQALEYAQQGQQPIWPAFSRTRVDKLLVLFRGRGNTPAAGHPGERQPWASETGPFGGEQGSSWGDTSRSRPPTGRPRSEPPTSSGGSQFGQFGQSSFGPGGDFPSWESQTASPGFGQSSVPTMGPGQPSFPQQGGSGVPGQSEWNGWPSLDLPAEPQPGRPRPGRPQPNLGRAEQPDGDLPSFPPLDTHPWYLPPEE